MTVKREDLSHVRCMKPRQPSGLPRCTALLDSGQRCGADAPCLCDYPDPSSGNESGTCSAPCCPRHTRYWTGKKQVCASCAKKVGIS